MCSTCDLAGYQKVDKVMIRPIGYKNLAVVYDPTAKKYFVADQTDSESKFRIYYCLTCGRKLWTKEG